MRTNVTARSFVLVVDATVTAVIHITVSATASLENPFKFSLTFAVFNQGSGLELASFPELVKRKLRGSGAPQPIAAKAEGALYGPFLRI